MPYYNITKIDETSALTDPTSLNIARYWTVYLFDPAEAHYCCELTASYWLEAVGYDIEPVDQDIDPWIDDDTYGDLIADLSYSSHYRHIKAVPDSQPFGEFETLEDAREYYQANPWYC
ncbi:hypothetical protein [uncultured Halomonas sp.]|uniref:hypothetical protein n=1 Tax=uncultured Halomonas sp. TaxID=173971 RepID=UPI002605A61F|nr:hypothetical protein [uncultured Halomonas sp.]